MKPVVEIGTRVEMFVDEWLVEERRGVSLKLHPPRREEIVLSFDQPWEGNGSGYATVIQEQDKIRLYYRGVGSSNMNADHMEVTCYAESIDGIHFVKPELGLYEYGGSTANNIVWEGPLSHNFSPFLDRSPYVSTEQRYKAVSGIDELNAFVSEDGIHWGKLQENPILKEGDFDSLNVVFWDVNAQAYRCYSRIFQDKNTGPFLPPPLPIFTAGASSNCCDITICSRCSSTTPIRPYFVRVRSTSTWHFLCVSCRNAKNWQTIPCRASATLS